MVPEIVLHGDKISECANAEIFKYFQSLFLIRQCYLNHYTKKPHRTLEKMVLRNHFLIYLKIHIVHVSICIHTPIYFKWNYHVWTNNAHLKSRRQPNKIPESGMRVIFNLLVRVVKKILKHYQLSLLSIHETHKEKARSCSQRRHAFQIQNPEAPYLELT